MARLNCWEYMRCGREHGGANARGRCCPASTQGSATGLNGGECAGRLCWSVADTLCHGRVTDGSAAQKANACRTCDFFQLVSREEGISFQLLEYEHSQAW